MTLCPLRRLAPGATALEGAASHVLVVVERRAQSLEKCGQCLQRLAARPGPARPVAPCARGCLDKGGRRLHNVEHSKHVADLVPGF